MHDSGEVREGLSFDTLYDQLSDRPFSFFHEIISLAQGGAAYLQAPHLLQRNVRALLSGLRASYPNAFIAYSYKTNYSTDLIQSAREAGVLSEVVSVTELDYALSLGVRDADILFNGPGKSAQVLRRVLPKDLTVIVDSIGELARADALVQAGVPARARIGLRFTPRTSFMTERSRFGIDGDADDQIADLRRIAGHQRLNICGAHLHVSQDRSVASFEERLRFLAQSWTALNIGNPAFLDCGGGMGSAMPEGIKRQLPYRVSSLPEYGQRMGQAMAELFPAGNTALYCEPGTGLLGDVTVYVTPVLDVKTIGGDNIAVVDGTLFAVNPLRSAVNPVAFLSSKDPSRCRSGPCHIYGSSCMDIDLLVRNFGKTPSVGDVVVIGQKGAYARAMAPPFIHGIPALVSLDQDGGLRVARARTDASLLADLS
jgi:diaminopimelate decarboxylase